ncbi:RNA polymerase sigma-70 factor [Actinomadura viridis]|uniref:RNA polymerase sigma-70 factor (ECF subfamily) n=1 Tax=Actinomadura viridis TaxID=58110 RepID=A0A931DMS9_9ACTN|nr:RNA polymerase sigma-70 factor [Actinomadura viridis]MBG6092830.1 RNA polymerase sigma-70 factor (ECF subfamily) [Actinomadura viridis]
MPSEPAAGETGLDQAAAEFARVRPRLFGIAYRVLGSSADAEDIVQEVWVRWQGYDRGKVQDPPAFLATTATRLSINVARSARSRRETYIGPWLPEPVDTSADPALGAERGEALELAVLLLLERLPPTERAAYVLREAFDYPYSQIADIVQVEEANARQLVSRARKHIAAERHASVGAAQQGRLLKAFLAAAQSGDLATLEELFAADVVSYSDGDGVRGASRIPVAGRVRVARYVAAFATRFWAGTSLTWVEANGQASVLVSRDGVVTALVTVGATAEGIDRLMWVMNPDKLSGISPAPPGP